MPRIVVLDGFTFNPGDNPWAPLQVWGEVTVHDRSPGPSIAARSAGAAILLTNKTPLSAQTLAGLPELRGVCVLATGVNVVDLVAASALGLPVCNIPAYSTASAAQHTVALLLELTNQVGLHDRAVHAGEWVNSEDFCFSKAPLLELSSLLLGIVGFGAIGRRVAEVARALGMRVQAAGLERRASDPEWLARVGMDELFRSSDVVSLHCPLSPETRELVNAERLQSMKPSALLLNAGRGALVHEQALADALNQGVLAGAAIDVLSVEPPAPENPLLVARNCLVTPHVAWLSLAARQRAMHITAENVRGILQGRPQNVVNA